MSINSFLNAYLLKYCIIGGNMADFVRKSSVKEEVKKVGKDMRCPDDTIEGRNSQASYRYESA